MNPAVPRPTPHPVRDRLVERLLGAGFRPTPAAWTWGRVALGFVRHHDGVVDNLLVPEIGPCSLMRTEVLSVPGEPSWLLGEVLGVRDGRLTDLVRMALAPVHGPGRTS
ncbi:hypothetical protein ACFXGA_27120 [Actinosynnema sp. NPDC059335]|uniref:hypothetical protein n=1 Tax=Actinosynnema sp. NPDC059335 TaxID=3346804 RepID=UPI00366DC75C